MAPYLQKLLDWVRDSRAMFVRWGGGLVNIFRVVKQFIIGVIDLAKQFGSGFMRVWEGTLGKTKKTWSDFFDILVFKIMGTIIFFQAFMEPVFYAIGQAIGFMAVGVNAFFKGLSDGMEGIMTPLTELRNMFTELANDIFGDEEVAKEFAKIMEQLGFIVGTVTVVAIELLVATVRTLVVTLQEAYYLTKALLQLATDDFSGAMESFNKMGEVGERYWEKQKQMGKRTWGKITTAGVRLGVMDEEKQVEDISPATRTYAVDKSNTVKQDVKVTIGQITVQSQTDNPVEHGTKTGYAIEQELRRTLMNNLHSQGIYPIGVGQ
jgi:hypothetical protein